MVRVVVGERFFWLYEQVIAMEARRAQTHTLCSRKFGHEFTAPPSHPLNPGMVKMYQMLNISEPRTLSPGLTCTPSLLPETRRKRERVLY